MNSSAQRGTAVAVCPSVLFQSSLAPAIVGLLNSLHFWTSKEKLKKKTWRGVWRRLGIAQLEAADLNCLAVLKGPSSVPLHPVV